MSLHRDVVAANGVPFRVLLIEPGEPGPNHPDLPSTTEPVAEFYDRRYGHTPDGQFIARYYVDHLLDVTLTGLDLDGGVPEWSIDAVTLGQVTEWLEVTIRACEVPRCLQKAKYQVLPDSDVDFSMECCERHLEESRAAMAPCEVLSLDWAQ